MIKKPLSDIKSIKSTRSQKSKLSKISDSSKKIYVNTVKEELDKKREIYL